MKKMMQGWYVVDTPGELEGCLEQLRQGIDPLKPARQALIEELFGENGDTPTERILKHLLK